MTSCSLSCTPSPSEWESSQKEKKLFPRGADFFLLDLSLPKGTKHSDRVVFPESVSISLKYITE